VLEFGIAKVLRERGTAGPTTGFVSFTPQYAAPEQMESRYGETGPWTDVYSLALVMTEMLADRSPFDGDDLSVVLPRVFDPHRRPSPQALGIPVPDAMEAVLARALAVDPRARHADAGDFWAALRLAATSPPPAFAAPPPAAIAAIAAPHPPAGYPPVVAPAPRSSRTATIVAVVVGVGLGLLVLVALATWIVTRR